MVKITSENVKKMINKIPVSVVVFSAEWCGPCRNLSPIIDELMIDNENNDRLAIGKINVDEDTDIADEFGVRGIPTIIFLKDGVVDNKTIGLKTKQELQEIIDNML